MSLVRVSALFFVQAVLGVACAAFETGNAAAESDGGADGEAPPDVRSEPDAEGGVGPRCSGLRGPRGVLVDAVTPFCIDATEVGGRDFLEFAQEVEAKRAIVQHPTDCAYKLGAVTSMATGEGEFFAGEEEPVRGVDWCDAFAYCAWAGKRLCGRVGTGEDLAETASSNHLVDEWFAACSRLGTRTYPFGDAFVTGTCGTESGDIARPGSRPGCVGGVDGVFDLLGNVREWQASCSGEGAARRCLTRGGGAGESVQGSYRCAASIPQSLRQRYRGAGIRCCADAR